MSALFFVGSIICGALTAQFLLQIISSIACACIYLRGFFSPVRKRLNATFALAMLAQALVFAGLLVGIYWLLVAWGPAEITQWDTAMWLVGFAPSFIWCFIQVPDKILAARMCATQRGFAERARAIGMEAALKTWARRYSTDDASGGA
jgi:hypothetical protein